MILIQGHRRSCRERISKDLLRFSAPSESNYDKAPINPFAVGLLKSLATKYTEEDLQKILRTVLEAQAPPFDGPHKKLLKTRLPDVYFSKSHIECYNFCQQYENYFITAGAKGPNRIPFATFFLHNYINFCWHQYKRKHKAECSVPIIWKIFKTFFCQSLEISRVFVDSY